MRDMSQQQFRDALKRHGMTEMGFMGYVNINILGHHLEVSKLNAGENRRAQLAYLLRCREREMEECHCGHMKVDHHFPVRDEATKKIVGVRCSKCECGVPGPKPESGTILRADSGRALDTKGK